MGHKFTITIILKLLNAFLCVYKYHKICIDDKHDHSVWSNTLICCKDKIEIIYGSKVNAVCVIIID